MIYEKERRRSWADPVVLQRLDEQVALAKKLGMVPTALQEQEDDVDFSVPTQLKPN